MARKYLFAFQRVYHRPPRRHAVGRVGHASCECVDAAEADDEIDDNKDGAEQRKGSDHVGEQRVVQPDREDDG
eukprot:3231818-Pleurochrysis_carterae.AAC.2